VFDVYYRVAVEIADRDAAHSCGAWSSPMPPSAALYLALQRSGRMIDDPPAFASRRNGTGCFRRRRALWRYLAHWQQRRKASL
jgi:hypothetical protein